MVFVFQATTGSEGKRSKRSKKGSVTSNGETSQGDTTDGVDQDHSIEIPTKLKSQVILHFSNLLSYPLAV